MVTVMAAALSGVVLGAWITFRASRSLSPVPTFRTPATQTTPKVEVEQQPKQVRV